jgi:hypothetical protein
VRPVKKVEISGNLDKTQEVDEATPQAKVAAGGK